MQTIRYVFDYVPPESPVKSLVPCRVVHTTESDDAAPSALVQNLTMPKAAMPPTATGERSPVLPTPVSRMSPTDPKLTAGDDDERTTVTTIIAAGGVTTPSNERDEDETMGDLSLVQVALKKVQQSATASSSAVASMISQVHAAHGLGSNVVIAGQPDPDDDEFDITTLLDLGDA